MKMNWMCYKCLKECNDREIYIMNNPYKKKSSDYDVLILCAACKEKLKVELNEIEEEEGSPKP